MTEKKVVIFIVEGSSDEAALGTIMKEYFASNEVQFVVVHGDITLKDYVSADNIIKKIKGQIEAVKNKYPYQWGDFIRIVHIVDMDGVYIPDEVVRAADVEAVRYFEDHIEAKNVLEIRARNKRKGEILYKLRTTGKIRGIPYQIYFNSCNLEHVLYGELKDFTNEEKEIRSDNFADLYEGRAEAFIEFISGLAVAVPGTYKDTWNYIEKNCNSLNRHSNMHLLFEQNGASSQLTAAAP